MAAVKGLHVIVSIVPWREKGRGGGQGGAAVNGPGGPLKYSVRGRSFVSQWRYV